MPRREYTGNWPCREARAGCRERAGYIYSTRAEYADAARRYATEPWTCTRHSNAEEVLGLNNMSRTAEVVAGRIRVPGYDRDLAQYEATMANPQRYYTPRKPEEFLPGLFWSGSGALTSGFIHGPGFKAFADDFPEGTRLRVTVEVVLPDVAESADAA